MTDHQLKQIAKLLRYYILLSTTKAGSGHPTSSLSAVEIITSLFFANYFKADFSNIKSLKNDRLVLSKGHASPLLYSLYVILGLIDKNELINLRTFNSWLEGHPIPDNYLVDVATGSLGQGLSVGLGMAMGLRLKRNSFKKNQRLPTVWVLLGDSELAEGQIWESIQIASYYQVNNLVALVDINRLGQRGETMVGWDLEKYQKRFTAFGWHVVVVDDGHNFLKIKEGFNQIKPQSKKPKVILFKTIKGKGISFLENKEGFHGKALSEEQFFLAIKELGEFDEQTILNWCRVHKPIKLLEKENDFQNLNIKPTFFDKNDLVATRYAYGLALKKIGKKIKSLVVLDAEVSNSTYAELFKKKFPIRFFEMFIAEQNMISCAVGFSKVGFIPFCSSFSAFLTRAFDQIRMAAYSMANIKICGSHAGVSIGQDGVSQMGLEDLSMMRSIFHSIVFYPSDAVSTEKLTFEAVKHSGIVYIRTTRNKTPIIYEANEEFPIGEFKILKKSEKDQVLVIASGITVFQSLKAYQLLNKENIKIRVIDLYCLKPINKDKLKEIASGVKFIVTVEDHYLAGGLGEAVSSAISDLSIPIYHLFVKKMPKSGQSEELFAYEGIDSSAIIRFIKEKLNKDDSSRKTKLILNKLSRYY